MRFGWAWTSSGSISSSSVSAATSAAASAIVRGRDCGCCRCAICCCCRTRDNDARLFPGDRRLLALRFRCWALSAKTSRLLAGAAVLAPLSSPSPSSPSPSPSPVTSTPSRSSSTKSFRWLSESYVMLVHDRCSKVRAPPPTDRDLRRNRLKMDDRRRAACCCCGGGDATAAAAAAAAAAAGPVWSSPSGVISSMTSRTSWGRPIRLPPLLPLPLPSPSSSSPNPSMDMRTELTRRLGGRWRPPYPMAP
mmetsp:Transcript_28582/g.82746  ORF Transcript_28582/g.82746 Transcript_28582/m.82746 type:complete len:249 (-) Transcript_28582:506-1252(-)